MLQVLLLVRCMVHVLFLLLFRILLAVDVKNVVSAAKESMARLLSML